MEDASEDDIEQASKELRPRRSPAAAILDAIRALPDAYRETLILRLVEGMTGPEIAARTGLTHGSVRVNLHRGMQQLRAKLSANPSSQGHELQKPKTRERRIIERKTNRKPTATTICGMDRASPIPRSKGWKRYSGNFAMTVPPRHFPKSPARGGGNSFRAGWDCFPLWRRPPPRWPLSQC